ncbi:MAG: metalloregulator ArsR/SmtB family transcription factor [candidate division WOR-3 bacterium]
MHIKTSPGPDTIFAALSHPVRLEIVAMLSQGERCVCEIAPELDRDRTVVSRHLMILEQAGILLSRQEGRRVIYKIADERVLELLRICLEMVKKPKRG